MKPTNFKIPFDAVNLFSDNGRVQKCGMEESIAQHLMLLITTRQGENRFDDAYGNEVWNIEFENATSEGEWERTFKESMVQQINKYEKRIFNPIVQVKVAYLEQSDRKKNFTEIKKKASIHIQATLTDSQEQFYFSTEIYLSPLSVD